MKIVTYNMQLGGRRGENWRHVIKAFDPNLVLAQEAFQPERSGLAETVAGCFVWQPAQPNTDWGSAILVRDGSIRELELFERPAWMPGWVVCGDVQFARNPDGEARSVRVFSVHAPPKSVCGVSYPDVVNLILDVVGKNRGDGDVIVGGDFNLYSLGIRHKSETWNQKPWKTNCDERKILERLENDLGLVNCWQTAHPGMPLAQTLRVKNNPTRPLHCDGIFVPKSWEATMACDVEDSEEWTSPSDNRAARSDHNPVVATVIPQP